MAVEETTLDCIPDNKPVRVFLPLSGRADRYRASSIFQQEDGDCFTLLFKHGVLPTDSLELGKSCLVTADIGGSNITIEAAIKEIVSDQELRLATQNQVNHDQMREFFRVDATTSITCRAFPPKFENRSKNRDSHWSIQGKTVDISGCGVLAVFTELPPDDKQMYLDITLPGFGEEVRSIVARKCRSIQLAEEKFEIAFEFVDIPVEDRDKIIGCCLTIQRKLLRLKVHDED